MALRDVMDTASAAVTSAYVEGARLLMLDADNIARTMTLSLVAWAVMPDDWFRTAGSSATRSNYKSLGMEIDRWRTTFRQWADAGKREDGSSYTPDRWFEHGIELREAVTAQSGYALEAGLLRSLWNTVRDPTGWVDGAIQGTGTTMEGESPSAGFGLWIGIAVVGYLLLRGR